MRLNAEKIEVNRERAEHCFGAQAMIRQFGSRLMNQRGFTLVELVTIMVIIGILGAVAVPRFFDRGTFDSRGFHDQVLSTLRYAQKAAIAERRFVCVAFPSNRAITLTYDPTAPSPTHLAATCPGLALASPAGQVNSPTVSVILSNYFDFNFDAQGRANRPQNITVSGYTPAITVVQETGYVF